MRSTCCCYFRACVKLHHVVSVQKVIVNQPCCCDSCHLFPILSLSSMGWLLTGQPRTASIKAFGQALRILGAGNAWLSVLYCSASDIIDGKVCFQTLCDVITL